MKLPSRITAAAVLLAPYLVGTSPFGGQPSATPGSPILEPVTLDALRKHGAVKLSIPRRLISSQVSVPLEYDLLDRFASDLGVRLVKREAPSEEAAAGLLRSGFVDAAVLPRTSPLAGDLIQVDAGMLALFVRSDSPELAGALTDRLERDFASNDAGAGAGAAGAAGGAPALIEPISRYARVIAKYAGEAGLDWRLVAAVISEESRFEPRAVSAKGARGLMQIMPATCAEVGFKNVSEPESNIQAGVLYLQRLSEQFPNVRASDHLATVLAAYVVGPGHVVDAQDLARELGLSPHRWHRGLEETLPLLEDERFYGSARLGYAHGQQAVLYVNRVLDRYELYRKRLGETPDLRASADRVRPVA